MKFLVFGLVAVAILAVVGLWRFQTHTVYGFGRKTLDVQNMSFDGAQILAFVSEDGHPLKAVLLEGAPDRPVILSFFGNFASIEGSFNRLRPLYEAGFSVVMLQYRGANGAPGQPSEEAFAADARALYDQLDDLMGRQIDSQARVVHGMSLGAAVAGRLATDRVFGAVVLEAAPERLCQYWTRHYRGIPFCQLMWRERYDLVDRIGSIEAPILLVHGGADRSIPPREAEALAAAAPGVELLILPEGGHANLHEHGLFAEMERFLAAAL